MGAFPNAAQCLLCSESPNSLISLYCSGDTQVTIEFPTHPRISTSMSLRYLQALLGFFQNARCLTVGRSSPVSARVIAPPALKECMVNAVRSPALRACILSAFCLPPNGCTCVWPSRDPRKEVPLRHVPAQRSPHCDVLLDCSYGACGHTLSVVLYCHEVVGAVSHCLPPL